MADFNSDTILGGLQIGNQWAAQAAHNRQNAFENQFRTQAEQDKLKEAFGEDTVFDSKGRVDVIGSSAKRRLRADKEALESTQGALEAWRQINPPAGASVVPPGDVSRPVAPPRAIAVPSPTPAVDGGDVPDPQTGEVRPVISRPIVQPDESRLIPVEPPYAGGAGAMGQSRTNFFAPKPAIQPPAAVVTPVDESPMVVTPPVAPPVPTSTPRAVVPPSTITPPVTPPIPDMTGWSPAKARAFVAQYPKVIENQRKTAQELSIEQNRLAIEQMRLQATKEKLENDLKKTDKLVSGRESVTDKLVEGRQGVADTKAETDLKKAAMNQAGKATQLSVEDRKKINDLTSDVDTKQRIASALDINIAQLTDPKIDPFVKRQAGLSILKTLNSAEGKDAVGAEEAKRLGQFLQFQLNPVKSLETGRYFGTDMPRFIQQISIKRDELKQRAEETQKKIDGISSKYQTGAQKVLDADTARSLLNQAKGDKEAARRLAKEAGYTIP